MDELFAEAQTAHARVKLIMGRAIMNGTWRCAFVYALTAMTLVFATGHVAAAPANPRIVYSFCPDGDPCHRGSLPTDLVRGPDGAFYGVTFEGGILNSGVVFRADPVTHVYSVLHRFDPRSEGSGPAWLTVGSDGNLYGGLSPSFDGVNSIYRLTLAGEFTELHRLGLYQFLDSAMVEDGEGNWYGLIYDSNEGKPFVYKITPDGVFSILYNGFQPSAAPSPELVLASDGNLYGTTEGQGQVPSSMAYRLTRDGVFTNLHYFNEMAEPSAPSIGPDGALYGLLLGQDGNGSQGLSMYRIDLDGQVTEQNLPVLTGRPRYTSEPLTLMPDGYFYGMFGNGPTFVFRLSSSGDYHELYEIPYDVTNGYAISLIPGFRGDALYGVSYGGGKYGWGMINRFITPPVQ